ncbi:MAG: hypothetical protein COA79_13175 [Planctomycetota bacterium]|nr:MAG: hypothetical protein COA79_13175 [Planctomycetota bacterium]
MSEILFCGDTDLKAAAAYLAGVINLAKYKFNYLNSDTKFPEIKTAPKLLILSDYPSKNISKKNQKKIIEWVNEGMSLWMIGGWESYYGLNGEYKNDNSIMKILPVKVKNKDDRINSFHPYVLCPQFKHPILKGLPWHQAPSVGGLNEVTLKNKGEILLTAQKLIIKNKANKITSKTSKTVPMLVSGIHGKGKTLCLMTDLAPHWVGGFVDWGNKRVQAKAPKANDVEVGNHYAKFIQQILKWLI